MDLALLVLRIVVGALFIGHGTQKLFGWFGGGGLDGTGGFFASLGFRPGRLSALLAGIGEAGGGLLVLLGLLTPLGAVGIIGVMTVAIVAVRLRNGLWISNDGYELELVYISAALSFATAPGEFSLDAALGLADDGVWGLAWGIGALLLGVLAGFARLATSSSPAPAPSPRS
jgi:putative oxidoreductase